MTKEKKHLENWGSIMSLASKLMKWQENRPQMLTMLQHMTALVYMTWLTITKKIIMQIMRITEMATIMSILGHLTIKK